MVIPFRYTRVGMGSIKRSISFCERSFVLFPWARLLQSCNAELDEFQSNISTKFCGIMSLVGFCKGTDDTTRHGTRREFHSFPISGDDLLSTELYRISLAFHQIPQFTSEKIYFQLTSGISGNSLSIPTNEFPRISP